VTALARSSLPERLLKFLRALPWALVLILFGRRKDG
jgi:hypothetical protein